VITLLLFIRTALSGLRQTPFVHAVAVLTLGIALFAGAAARAAEAGLGALLGRLGQDVEVTLYLSDDISIAQVRTLEALVARESGALVQRVEPAEALARLKKELGDSGAVLDGLPENPLPRTLEVRPQPGVAPDPERLRLLAKGWAAQPGVTAADYGREWVDRLAALHRILTRSATVLLALVLLAAVIVVSATLQLAAYARRDEIEIQKLVGATDFFVRAPYLIEGMFQGLLGAAVALLGLYASQRVLGPPLLQGLSMALGDLHSLGLLTAQSAVEVVVAGMVLGVIGSSLAVGRFLRV
jgi:cell division transport system permease protein